MKKELFYYEEIQNYVVFLVNYSDLHTISREQKKRKKLWSGPWWLIILVRCSNFLLHWFNNHFSPIKTIFLLIQLQLCQILGMSLVQTMAHKITLGLCLHKMWCAAWPTGICEMKFPQESHKCAEHSGQGLDLCVGSRSMVKTNESLLVLLKDQIANQL